MARRELDLYSPSLDATHDARGMRASWNPMALLVPVFFGGPFCAALLFGLNARWLVLRRQALGAWILFSLIGVTFVVVALRLDNDLAVPFFDPDSEVRDLRLTQNVATLLPAYLFSRAQVQRHRLSPHEDRRLLAPGVGAILFAIAAYLAVSALFAAVTGYGLRWTTL